MKEKTNNSNGRKNNMKKTTEIILEISNEINKLQDNESRIREKVNILWLTDAIVTSSLKYDVFNNSVSAKEFRTSCEESKKEN